MINAWVTGLNIVRIVSKCFCQKRADLPHSRKTSADCSSFSFAPAVLFGFEVSFTAEIKVLSLALWSQNHRDLIGSQ
jgi:hypothetical protein